MDNLLNFWNSDEYQSIKHLRTEVIEPHFTFAVDGFRGFSADNDQDHLKGVDESSIQELTAKEDSNIAIPEQHEEL